MRAAVGTCTLAVEEWLQMQGFEGHFADLRHKLDPATFQVDHQTTHVLKDSSLRAAALCPCI